MNNADFEEISFIIKHNIKKIAGNSGFGYLDCNHGEWKDGGEYVHKIYRMESNHLKNCLKEIDRSARFSTTEYEYISEVVDLNDYELNDEEKNKIRCEVIGFLHELFEEKRNIIISELKSREIIIK